MKRTLAILFTAVFLGSSVLLPAIASGKQGTPCKKLGHTSIYSGKKYTCVQSGKKLVWNQVINIKKPTTNATPSPTPTPSPLIPPSQTEDDVSKKVNQIRIEVLQKPTSTIPNLIFLFQGATSSEIESKTKRSLLNAVAVYKKFGFNTTDGLILVARDIDWVKQELLKNQCNNGKSIPDRPGFYYGRTCKDGNGVVTSVHWEAEKFSDGLDGLYFNHVIPHEYFHQIQEQLTAFGNADFPKWFWEGSAQFFTNQAWTSWNDTYSYLDWYHHWWTNLRPDLGPISCKNATISLMSDPGTPGVEGICAYSKGQLIVEYLVSKYGLEKYRKLYIENSISGWMNFNIVFRKVTGEDLVSFYTEAEQFVKSRGW